MTKTTKTQAARLLLRAPKAPLKRMPRRLRNRWLRALLSGKYPQGRSELKANFGGTERFCCLGVLREIEPGLRKARNGECLSKNAAKAIGLGAAPKDAFTVERTVQQLLAAANDDGATFKEIAHWIEKYL